MNADQGGPPIVVYRRAGCHLCELLLEELAPLIRGRAGLELRDVDASEDWRAAFGMRIPVVELEGRVVCEGKLNAAAVDEALRAAGRADHI